jgi:hypothetical protein
MPSTPVTLITANTYTSKENGKNWFLAHANDIFRYPLLTLLIGSDKLMNYNGLDEYIKEQSMLKDE